MATFTLLCAAAQGQNFVKLNFDDAASGTFTTGTVYTAGASELVNTAGVGLGTASFKFVDSEGPDDGTETTADGASIGVPPAGIVGTGQGGKALLVNSGTTDEGLRMFVGDRLANQSFTMETIWYTANVATPNNASRQTIIGDNWPQLNLFSEPDPLRSQFQIVARGRDAFDYSGDQGTVTISGTGVNVANLWYHDALVFEYNSASPANSQVRGYRNGRIAGIATYNAGTGEDVGLFGVTTQSLNLHYITIGMNNSFEYRINDHRRSLNGGVDAVAISAGVLSPNQFVLPYAPAFSAACFITNPSFEMDAVPADPGYGPIKGWVDTGASTRGINTSPGAFFDNGTAPDGSKVAFLQEASGIRQMAVGFQSGMSYTFKVQVNKRAGSAGIPRIQVTVGSTIIIPSTQVASVGGTNQFTQLSATFTAPSTGALAVIIQNLEGAVDNTLLLDNVIIEPTPNSAQDWELLQ